MGNSNNTHFDSKIMSSILESNTLQGKANISFGSGIITQNINVEYGDIVSSLAISGATMTVKGGTVVSNIFIAGVQQVSAGDVFNTSFVSGNQLAYGGFISNTSITSGYQTNFGATIMQTVIVNGGQVLSSGRTYGTYIISGYQRVDGGEGDNLTIDNGSQIINSGTFMDVRISSGYQTVSGGAVSNTSIVNGYQTVSGGAANYTNIVNGYQIVSGGDVFQTSIGSGYQKLAKGGYYVSNFINNGYQINNSGTVINTSINSGYQIISGGLVSNTSINSGYQIISGGTVYDTNIGSGNQSIFEGIASNTIINNGSQIVSGGAAYNTTISRGSQLVESGGGVYNTSVIDNGALGDIRVSQTIASGGIASNTFISGGHQYVEKGAIANDTTVTDGVIYGADGATFGKVIINDGGLFKIDMGTNLQGVVTLNQGGSAQIGTSNGGGVNLVGDENGGLTIIGNASAINNTSVTTQIQGFSGINANNSDAISLQYDGFETGKLSNVTFPDNDHITITMDTGFVLTLNIVGIKQTGYAFKSAGDTGLILTVCFLSGTEIQTKAGAKNIESLQSGDFVTTYDWKTNTYIESEVTWIGRTHCRVNKSLPDDMAGYPVRILKDAIAKNVPYKDLLITAEHCLFFQDKFIPARMLVNGFTVFYDYSITSYDYFHVELEEHSVIIADGVQTESYLDTGNRHAFNHHRKIIETSLQSAKDWQTDAAAPLVVSREIVEPLYNQFNKRAQAFKVDYKGRQMQLFDDSDLHLFTDQRQIVRQKRMSGGWVTFMIPSTVQFVWINSRTNRLCDVIGPFIDNRHSLGVLVGDIKLFADRIVEFVDIHSEQEALAGWHGKQLQPGRWTNGNAFLPIQSKNLLDNSVIYVSLQILAGGPYLEIIEEESNDTSFVG